MSTTTRIYAVTDGPTTRLVEAATPAQAIRHVARRMLCTVASAKHVARLVSEGVPVELASGQAEAK